MNCIIDKQSAMANAIQYVLTELFRNVFLENTMMEIKFPINPIAITAVSIAVIAITKLTLDIFLSNSILLGIMRFHISFSIIYMILSDSLR